MTGNRLLLACERANTINRDISEIFEVARDDSSILFIDGIAIPAKIATIATTTISSNKVNPEPRRIYYSLTGLHQHTLQCSRGYAQIHTLN